MARCGLGLPEFLAEDPSSASTRRPRFAGTRPDGGRMEAARAEGVPAVADASSSRLARAASQMAGIGDAFQRTQDVRLAAKRRGQPKSAGPCACSRGWSPRGGPEGRRMAGEWQANGRRSASPGRDSFLRIAPGPPGSASALSSGASAGSRRQPFACPSGRLLGGVSSEGVFGGGMAARCCFCMAGCAPFAWLPAPSAWRRASPALAMDVARLLACAWSCLAIASGKKTCFCGDHGS